jgi:hypothetical protein
MADAKKSDVTKYATEYVKNDWDKVVFLDNPHTDNLMTAFLNLGAEMWVTRRRQLITEKLLSQGAKVSAEAIDAYNPSPEETAAWEKQRDEFIERTFSVLTRPITKVAGAAPSTTRVAPLNKP